MICELCEQEIERREPGQRLHDGCWELRTRVQREPHLARKVLDAMGGPTAAHSGTLTREQRGALIDMLQSQRIGAEDNVERLRRQFARYTPQQMREPYGFSDTTCYDVLNRAQLEATRVYWSCCARCRRCRWRHDGARAPSGLRLRAVPAFAGHRPQHRPHIPAPVGCGGSATAWPDQPHGAPARAGRAHGLLDSTPGPYHADAPHGGRHHLPAMPQA